MCESALVHIPHGSRFCIDGGPVYENRCAPSRSTTTTRPVSDTTTSSLLFSVINRGILYSMRPMLLCCKICVSWPLLLYRVTLPKFMFATYAIDATNKSPLIGETYKHFGIHESSVLLMKVVLFFHIFGQFLNVEILRYINQFTISVHCE